MSGHSDVNYEHDNQYGIYIITLADGIAVMS